VSTTARPPTPNQQHAPRSNPQPVPKRELRDLQDRVTGAVVPPCLVRACRAVLAALWTYTGSDGRCWPSQATLARRAGYSVRHVQRALTALERAGIVARACPALPHRRRHATTVYRVAPLAQARAARRAGLVPEALAPAPEALAPAPEALAAAPEALAPAPKAQSSQKTYRPHRRPSGQGADRRAPVDLGQASREALARLTARCMSHLEISKKSRPPPGRGNVR
jgi:hypothetical protein